MASSQKPTFILSDFCFLKQDYAWTIPNFKDVIKMFTKQCLYGPEMEFTIPNTGEKVLWKLYMRVDENGQNIDVTVLADFCNESSGVYGIQIIVSGTKNYAINCYRKLMPSSLDTLNVDHLKYSDDSGFVNLINYSRSPKPPQLMEINCKLRAYNLSEPSKHQSSLAPTYLKKFGTPAYSYSCDLILAFNKDRKEGLYTDAVLKWGKKEYKVHKVILAMESDVFKSQFDEGNEVDLNDPDLDDDLVEALVTGVYTGEIEPEFTLKLLPIFCKYGFNNLKNICEEKLSNDLNLKNVLQYLVLADQHNANILKNNCIGFCECNFAAIKNTKYWEEFLKSEHSELKRSLCHALLTTD